MQGRQVTLWGGLDINIAAGSTSQVQFTIPSPFSSYYGSGSTGAASLQNPTGTTSSYSGTGVELAGSTVYVAAALTTITARCRVVLSLLM